MELGFLSCPDRDTSLVRDAGGDRDEPVGMAAELSIAGYRVCEPEVDHDNTGIYHKSIF